MTFKHSDEICMSQCHPAWERNPGDIINLASAWTNCRHLGEERPSGVFKFSLLTSSCSITRCKRRLLMVPCGSQLIGRPHHGLYDLALTYLSDLISHHPTGFLAHYPELFIVPRELSQLIPCSLNPLPLPHSLLVTSSNLHWALLRVSPSHY